MESNTTIKSEAPDKPRRRRFRFQYSLKTLLIVVTVCALLLSYWASTRPVPPSAFILAAAYNSPGLPNAGEMVEQTLQKLCSGKKVHTMGGSAGTCGNGRANLEIDALVILPKQLHKKYHEELHQAWLDLLNKTQCTVKSDKPLPDHQEGFILTYTTGIKLGTLRVYCKPGGDQIKTYHADGSVTDVPYKDDILNVIIELHESQR